MSKRCPRCRRPTTFAAADMFTGICRACRTADAREKREASRRAEQARLIEYWTPGKAAFYGPHAVMRELRAAGMDPDAARKVVDGLLPGRLPPPEKPMSAEQRTELAGPEGYFYSARVLFGFFLMACLALCVGISVYRLRNPPPGFTSKVDETELVVVVVAWIVWFIIMCGVFGGCRWLIWTLLVGGALFLILDAAFLIGYPEARPLDGRALFRLLLLGGTVTLSLVCVHWMQRIDRLRRRHQRAAAAAGDPVAAQSYANLPPWPG